MVYKKIFKSLQKQKLTADLYKSDESHPIQKPHILMSVENPKYEPVMNMDHESFVNHLRSKGYKAHNLKGKYDGKLENSVMVEDVSPHVAKKLMDLARHHGQESVIYSDGKGSHELHYVNGENDGKHYKGFGTSQPLIAPEDNFSTMENGDMFYHSFDFSQVHPNDKSMLRQHFRQSKLRKNEGDKVRVYIPESLKKSEHTGRGVSLVHYSPKKGLKEISPSFHGARKIGLEAKRGAPDHKLAFFYREGATPEDVVTSGSNSKYVVNLTPHHRLYDIGEDTEGVRPTVKARADQKEINRGAVTNDDIHEELKNRGFHGFFNSKSSLPDVVAMFDSHPVHEEHDLHANDFKKVSTKNHHAYDQALESAKQVSKEGGHHSPHFLASLVTEK